MSPQVLIPPTWPTGPILTAPSPLCFLFTPAPPGPVHTQAQLGFVGSPGRSPGRTCPTLCAQTVGFLHQEGRTRDASVGPLLDLPLRLLGKSLKAASGSLTGPSPAPGAVLGAPEAVDKLLT